MFERFCKANSMARPTINLQTSPGMIDESSPDPVCVHCGTEHKGLCPRIKALEYHQDGTVKRIEYHTPWTTDASHATDAGHECMHGQDGR